MQETKAGGANHRKMLLLLVPLLVIGGGVAGVMTYASIPSIQHASGSGTNAASDVKVEFAVTITHQNERSANFLWMAQMAMKGQFWSASCYLLCSKGVTYTLDPTVITNEGHDVEQCDIFGSAGTLSSCQWGVDKPTVIWLSTSSNSVSATDTNAGSSGPCYSGATGVITTGGLKDAAGTVAAGTAGSTVTTTIAHTFTAAETDSAVQATCLKTETDSGSHIFIYAEGTFGPDTLTSGNTLAITWTISRT